MKFLKQFDVQNQEILRNSARILRLDPGQYLLRRGDPGGDIYVVQTGTLEVVDTRSTPEVILAYLEPGDVVGEMAFVDDSPRSADVRAGGLVQILHWPRDDMHRLLQHQPNLAAQFYESVARMAASRLRQLASTTVSGMMSHKERVTTPGAPKAKEDADKLAEEVKAALLVLDNALRQETDENSAVERVRQLLNRLQGQLNNLFTTYTGANDAFDMTEILYRELHPYLVRSALAERCTLSPHGMKNPAKILAHIMVDQPSGDPPLGQIIDRWLLDRPTISAFRDLQQPTVESVASALPVHRNRRVLLINAGTGSLVAALNYHLNMAPTVLTVVDQHRDALAWLDMGMTARPRQVELQTVQENLAQFAMGRSRHSFPKQDVIVMSGLMEYLPDRIAFSCLRLAKELLVHKGTVVLSALSPSDDQILMDRLLNWPTIRRTPARMLKLLERAGFIDIKTRALTAPAMLFSAEAEA